MTNEKFRKSKVWITTLVVCFLVASLWGYPLKAGERTVKITMGDFLRPEVVKLMESYVKEYMKEHPNVEIEYKAFPTADYWTKLLATMAAGTGQDIILAGSTSHIPYLAINKTLAVPPPEVQAAIKEGYPAGAVEYASWEGVLYAYPWHGGPRIMLYNREHFKEAGIAEYPRSVDEFIDVARKCTKYNAEGKMTREGFRINMGADAICASYPLVWSAGGDYFDEADRQPTFNTSPVIKTLELWRDLVFKYKVSDPGFPQEPPSFVMGLTSMFITGAWTLGQVRSYDPGMEKNLGGCLVPPWKKGDRYYADSAPWTLAVNATCENQKEAWNFIAWLLAPEREIEYSKLCGDLPYSKEAMKDPSYQEDPVLKVFIDSLNYVQPRKRRYYPDYMRTYAAQMDLVVLGKVTPEEAAENTQKEMTKIIKAKGI